ncbi:MAG: DUF362 domain-containing protein [Deltaproteobacteria bacterium]|nr:DUF362 domain-containing protein [Deltaproteobacteria bacterium]MBW2140440.1 DUF362 domain-containing protein [Deltaproteobacteria bacterium]MBW2323229.1 DUF362 domain-containing protein [Deltaproteobacteria bacterium]
MSDLGARVIDSPMGKREVDSTGAPVGVVRMDVDQSYAGVGELLQEYINHSSQEAWDKIKAKIDYTYDKLDLALAPLEKVTNFTSEIKAKLEKGQKLLFKPNLVSISNINPQTHEPDMGSFACTEWPFIAALMRWFHDKLSVSYYQMSLGEAATTMASTASQYSMMNPEGKTITTEAVIEGKSGNFYGGWGFYFVRKYLAESLAPGAEDDPMQGYEQSVAGTYIPPGMVSDKLMVYDLNRIYDDSSKGRVVEVPDGVNYKSIGLHKAIVGGNPEDGEDMAAYPGCILINVPKFKVHAITLFTNVIKNLGIGLYPMQYSSTGGYNWDYSAPNTLTPGMKAGIPHQVWIPELDEKTGLPKLDAEGNYIIEKTGGITATMIDIIKAVNSQDIFTLHIVDGIEAINIDHQGIGMGEKAPEGIVFTGLDPVATDLLCARYMFSNVPLKEAMEVDLDDGMGGRFPQRVPIPVLEGSNIVTETGYDCPLSRDICFINSQKRGLGGLEYYVIGHDAVADSPLISIDGHLGRINDGAFADLITERLFFDTFSFPWDLQKTTFNYLEITDKLAGTSVKKEFLETFDENGDGTLTYEEFGKKGIFSVFLNVAGISVSNSVTEPFGFLRFRFDSFAKLYKSTDPQMNPKGYDMMKEFFYGSACRAAYQISLLEMEIPDPFIPGLTCGKGKWPSFQLAQFFQMGMTLYGNEFPTKIAFPSLYGSAFFYADLTQNEGQYTGDNPNQPDVEAMQKYITGALNGEEKPLDFTFFVPEGFDNILGVKVPNVEVADDPVRIMTASFAGGREIWPEM